MLTVRLPKSVEKRLKTLSTETGRTKIFYVKEAKDLFQEELEDVYLSRQVLERIREGKEKVYTSKELEKFLGLDK